MKKYIASMTIASALILAACGSDNDNATEAEKEATPAEETTEQATETASEETTDSEESTETEAVEEEDAEPGETAATGDVVETEDWTVETIYLNEDLGISGTTGPIDYTIDGVELVKVTVKSELAAASSGASIGDQIEGFIVNASGENTSDDDVRFALLNATAITNTKEQLEYSYMLSDIIESEYLGQVIHSGNIFYSLNNSSVDDLESIELRIREPINTETYDSLGEAVTETIEITQ